MKFSRILFLLTFILCSFNSMAALEKAVGNYPSFEDMVNTFFNTYNAPAELTAERLVKFARKKDGWHVYVTDFTGKTTVADEVVWSGKFQELTYFVNKKDKKREIGTFASHQDKPHHLTPDHIRQFRIHTFFGYNGWAEDIISELEKNSKKLNDDDLYSLGRAYSAITGAITYRNPDAVKDQPEKPANFRLDGDALTRYMNFNQKARDAFKTIAQRNPNFYDIVGKIQTKYANEVVQAMLDLWMYHDEVAARKQLIPNIYPEEILTNARNYLLNCPSNAILISVGDNDTYPLWYLQWTEGYRSDVTVVNQTLLNIPEYIKGLNLSFNGRAVAFSIANRFYQSMEYALLPDSGLTINQKDFLQIITNKATDGVLKDLKFNKVSLELKGGNGSITTPGSAFLTVGDIALLDICITNFRPIAVTKPDQFTRIFHQTDYQFRGVVYELKLKEGMADFDHDAINMCIQTFQTNGYEMGSNYPKKADGTYVDDVFIAHLWPRWANAFSDVKDPETLRMYKKFWTKYAERWVIKPNAADQQLVDQL
ncbi:MAG: hypothetical protein H6608_04655 [Flavobacteriales bacterium]|nr:hypothetical protein [Flavobacteriales bacterium]